MRPVYWFEEVKQELVKHIGASAWRIGQLKNLEVPGTRLYFIEFCLRKIF